MELLDGLDADALVRRFGPMPAERVVYVLRQMCHSMSEAQSCGLVHRDIKPANVFLCRYGEDHDFVKVLDFGIAKAAHETRDTETALTVANMIQGTPAFIAPEQALGGVDMDARADIYSAGCVAYWLLTGELVFTADTTMKLLLAHAQAPPSHRRRERNCRFPQELDALVLSCLAKDRERRPESARELSSDSKRRARQAWTEHALVSGGRCICLTDQAQLVECRLRVVSSDIRANERTQHDDGQAFVVREFQRIFGQEAGQSESQRRRDLRVNQGDRLRFALVLQKRYSSPSTDLITVCFDVVLDDQRMVSDVRDADAGDDRVRGRVTGGKRFFDRFVEFLCR